MERKSEISKGKLPEGDDVKEILATGEDLGMRIWRNEEPGTDKDSSIRPYETVGYVLKGRAQLHLEDDVQELKEGDSYLVPRGAKHSYNILETFSAVEVTTPPAHLVNE